MKILFVFIMVVVFPVTIQAATYWVSKSSNGDGNACFASDSQPTLATQSRLTIVSGASCMSDNDTLKVGAGDYDEYLLNIMPNGGTLTSIDTTEANWFVLKPTNNTVPQAVGALNHTQDRTGVLHYQYIHIDLSSITSGNKPSSCFKTGNTGVVVQPILEDFTCLGPAEGMVWSTGSGLSMGPDNISPIIRRGSIKNMISTESSPGVHGIYFKGHDGLIERVFIDNINGYCTQFFGGGPLNNNIFRYNTCHNSSSRTMKGSLVLSGSQGSNNTAHHNIFWETGRVNMNGDSNKLYNNTFSGSPLHCVRTRGSNHIVRNNIALDCDSSPAIFDDGTGNTISNNLTSGTETDVFLDPVNGDFSLITSSAAINNGADLGFSFNGSSPDQGAFETFAFSSCEVGNIDNTSLIINFENNLFPPLLPSSAVSTFTVRDDGVNAPTTPVGSCARPGDNQIDCTLASAMTAGVVDIDWNSGNLTDSALIGNLAANVQPFLALSGDGTACTNNTAAPSTATFTQTGSLWRLSHGTEAGTPSGDAAEDGNWTVAPNGARRLRLEIRCDNTADCDPFGPVLYVDIDSGGYNAVTNTCSSTGICFYGTGDTGLGTTDGTSTTDQLDGTETFVSCEVKRIAGGVPNVDLGQNQLTECEWVLQVGSGVTNQVFSFRVGKDGGSTPDLDTYSVTPTLTARSLRGGF